MAHVNSLPNEILALIFRLVANAQSLGFEKLVDKDVLPVNSLATSQVCIQWRRAALGSQILWTRVDLSVREEMVRLGRIFVSRSGNLPLNIRILAPADYELDVNSNPFIKLVDFIRMIGPRMCSVEVATDSVVFLPNLEAWLIIMNHIFEHTSNRLTQLILSNYDTRATKLLRQGHGFWTEFSYWADYGLIFSEKSTTTPGTSNQDMHRILLDISKKKFDNVLFRIQNLKLDALYPHWESKAYHGLTELRLTGPYELTAVINTSQLASVLVASPKLRTFQFGLEVSLSKAQPKPIHLADLEVFLLQSHSSISQEAVLSLILPGSKPLLMSTTYDVCAWARFPTILKKEEELRRFFNRSNVVHLQIHSRIRVCPPSLLSLLPNLQSLVFREVTIEGKVENDFASPGPRLNALHFISCTIYLDGFRWLVSGGKLREVTIWRGSIIDDLLSYSVAYYRDTLTEVCPIVQVLDREDYAQSFNIEGWGEDMSLRIRRAEKRGNEIG